jgi:competence protein ComEC
VLSGATLSALNAVQQAQRGALMPWSAVALGLGVALYFGLPVEPGAVARRGRWRSFASASAWASGGGRRSAPLGLALALVAGGAMAAGLRAHMVAGPVLDFRYYGPVEGRIVGIDRSASDALRLTLDRVRLDDVAPERTPRRVRVSLHGDQRWLDPEPGARVMMTAHLGPPAGPAEPGGFDFQRHAWFLSLGAVGYTRAPALLAAPREAGSAAVFHLRMTISTGHPRPDRGAAGRLRRRGADGRPVGPRRGDGGEHARGQYRASAGDLGPAHGASDGVRLRRAAAGWR